MAAPTRKQPRHRAHVGGGSVSATRKQKQPRLLSAFAPIREADALTLDDLTTRYKCRCGNSAETGIKLDAITCVRCGSAMKAVS